MTSRRKLWLQLIAVVALLAVTLGIALPRGLDRYFARFGRDHYRLGLDLKGGSRLTYRVVRPEGASDREFASAEQGLRTVIERRVNALGVGETTVQLASSGSERTLVVELPGITDIEAAKRLVGRTALLEFYEIDQEINRKPPDEKLTPQVIARIQSGALLIDPSGLIWKTTGLSGQHLKDAQITFPEQSARNVLTQNPQVALTFTDEGAQIFHDLTRRLLNQPIAIAIDRVIISAPTVQGEIPTGNAVITGDFTIQEARELSTQLKSGALPLPVELVEERTVGPSLGQESVAGAIVAGLLGTIVVILFMLSRYRLYGLVASLALILYVLLLLTIFKLIPVTLTVAGIAGIILSIGAAVDANILIFERIREEVPPQISSTDLEHRSVGKNIFSGFLRSRHRPSWMAVETGFRRAWTSIRDSNMASLIIAGILFALGSGSVKGFAVTLGIGILVSLFTAVVVSRTLLKTLV